MTEFLTSHQYTLFWALAVLCMVWFFLHNRKRIRAMLLGSVTGLASLIAAHCFGGLIGYAPSLCAANLAVSAMLGVPGTLLILAVHFFQ